MVVGCVGIGFGRGEGESGGGFGVGSKGGKEDAGESLSPV